MRVQKFFHLDCQPVIPECAYKCSRCIKEIRDVIGAMDGVLEVSTGKHGQIAGVVVQYESDKTTDENLLKAFGQLPSFYRGRFIPKVLDA